MSDSLLCFYDELPDFASKENKSKHAMIMQKSSELDQLIKLCSDLHQRLSDMNLFSRKVQQDINITQQLLSTKLNQIDEAIHIQKVTDNERGTIFKELKLLDEETRKLLARIDAVTTRIADAQNRISQYQSETEENQYEIQQWIDIAKQKEEDFLVLKRYQRQDEGAVKSYMKDVDKLNGLMESKRNELENEVAATRALQIELNATEEHFRQIAAERQQLLSQWDATLEQLRTLNINIQKTKDGLVARRTEIEQVSQAISSEKEKLENEELLTQNVERQLTFGNHQINLKHRQLDQEVTSFAQFTEAVEKDARHLSNLNYEVGACQGEIENYQRLIAEEEEKRESHLERLQQAENEASHQQMQIAEIEDHEDVTAAFKEREENQLQTVISQIEEEKLQIKKMSDEIKEAKKRDEKLGYEIKNHNIKAKGNKMQIKVLDQEAQKQVEQLYQSNMQVIQMERRMARIGNDNSEEGQRDLKLQVKQLAQVLEGKKENEEMLMTQLESLQRDVNNANNRKEKLLLDAQSLQVKLNEIILEQESLYRSTIKARVEKEKVMVDLNMYQMQVEELNEQVAAKNNELISQEVRKQQIQHAMEERVSEIDNHLAALKVQLRTEEEAKQKAMLDFNSMRRDYENLEEVFQKLTSRNSPSNINRFQQEKEELNKKSDELESQLKKANNELKELEQKWREVQQQSILPNVDDILKATQEDLEAKKSEITSIQEEQRGILTQIDQKQEQLSAMQSQMSKLKHEVETLSNENRELERQVKVSNEILVKTKENHRKVSNIDPESDYPSSLLEIDIETKMIKMTMESAVSDLLKIADSDRELEMIIKQELSKLGLSSAKVPGITLSKPKAPSITAPKASARSTGSSLSMRNQRANKRFGIG